MIFIIHIYLFIYSDSLIFGKMNDKETLFSAEYNYFPFTCNFFLSIVYVLKNHDPPPLLDQPEKQ